MGGDALDLAASVLVFDLCEDYWAAVRDLVTGDDGADFGDVGFPGCFVERVAGADF